MSSNGYDNYKFFHPTISDVQLQAITTHDIIWREQRMYIIFRV